MTDVDRVRNGGDADGGVADGGDGGGAAKDVGAAKALIEGVHVGHAVEQREDGGGGADGGGEGVDGAGEVLGLATEEDEVVVAVQVFGEDGGGWREV